MKATEQTPTSDLLARFSINGVGFGAIVLAAIINSYRTEAGRYDKDERGKDF